LALQGPTSHHVWRASYGSYLEWLSGFGDPEQFAV